MQSEKQCVGSEHGVFQAKGKADAWCNSRELRAEAGSIECERCLTASNYQGMSFFKPFFFLLLDSF